MLGKGKGWDGEVNKDTMRGGVSKSIPPYWHSEQQPYPYKEWKLLLGAWENFSNLTDAGKASAIQLNLGGESQRVALTITKEQIAQVENQNATPPIPCSGLKLLLTTLDTAFLQVPKD